MITGIEIASWGVDLPGKPDLSQLLKAVCEAVPDLRIRLGSLEPRIITPAFCETLKNLKNLCPQFHLSMQSGCDTVLARMKRKYDTARYLESVQLLKQAFPGCAVTTDMIVAFPGETEEEFAQSLAFVDKQDFLDAVDRIVGGLEKKSKVMTNAEKNAIAIHEAGHATLSWFLEHANPLIKVTIVPRGRALGAAWYLPEERQITTKEQMLDEMCAILGGRAAEEIFLGHISTGAMNDLERVTKQAYGMIAYAGMSDKLPNLCYYNNNEYSFQRPYSERTAELIDNEVKELISQQYERAKAMLIEHKEGHATLAKVLLENEVIFAEDVEKIFGKRPWASRSEEIFADNNSEAPKESETATTPDTENAVETAPAETKEQE